jgi:hypothetical protein
MGTATFSIPKLYMGQTLQEVDVKKGLLEMNPEIHFDMGTCLNIWHPYQDSRQNIFYRGRSVVGMDRGTLPENPVWTVRKDAIEVPWSEVRYGEVCLRLTMGVLFKCLKCLSIFEYSARPTGVISCPTKCGNFGQNLDSTLWQWKDKPTGMVQVLRSVKDRVILVGWRHTFSTLMVWGIPGVDKKKLEERFRINLDSKPIDELEVSEDIEDRILDRKIALSA